MTCKCVIVYVNLQTGGKGVKDHVIHQTQSWRIPALLRYLSVYVYQITLPYIILILYQVSKVLWKWSPGVTTCERQSHKITRDRHALYNSLIWSCTSWIKSQFLSAETVFKTLLMLCTLTDKITMQRDRLRPCSHQTELWDNLPILPVHLVHITTTKLWDKVCPLYCVCWLIYWIRNGGQIRGLNYRITSHILAMTNSGIIRCNVNLDNP
jgi:hypothetical protein